MTDQSHTHTNGTIQHNDNSFAVIDRLLFVWVVFAIIWLSPTDVLLYTYYATCAYIVMH